MSQQQKIPAQRMEEHIEEAKFYVQGLLGIKQGLTNGDNQQESEKRYADKVVDFHHKLTLLLRSQKIHIHSEEEVKGDHIESIVNAVSAITHNIAIARSQISTLENSHNR